jgi:3-phenylpropionate/trans-cinnamate dioxygenase ferredoxin reductase subunit
LSARVVIVGAGQGGLQAAVSLREEGFTGPITLVGDEPYPPYQRPPLSKTFLAGSVEASGLYLRQAEFFSSRNIELKTGATVASVDRDERRILFAAGESLQYDHLVLATGARNRQCPIKGADLDGVLGLRGLADATELKARLGSVSRIAIIGGGYIGLEVCSLALSMGIEVVLLEAADRLVARVASPAISKFFFEHYTQLGAQIKLGCLAERISGKDGKVEQVHLATGETISTQMVLACIGVVPNVELAAAAGLDVKDGIVVNSRMDTSDDSISAIGDCARFPSPFCSLPSVRIESVPNAMDQAKCVAEKLMGRPRDFNGFPWFWSDQGKVKLQIAGLMQDADEFVVKGDLDKPAFSIFCFRQQNLIGVECINRPMDFISAKQLLSSGRTVTSSRVQDPAFDLKAYLKEAASLESSAPVPS